MDGPMDGPMDKAASPGRRPRSVSLTAWCRQIRPGRSLRRVEDRQSVQTGGATVTTADPLGLCRALEASGRFRRDSRLGGLFHHGKISYREVSATHSLHVVIDGNRVSAHVDEISPLVLRSNSSYGYSWARVLAHNVAAAGGDLSRRLRGMAGRQRCNLDCEVVWTEAASFEEGGPEATLLVSPPDASEEATEPAPDPSPGEVPFGWVDEAVHLLDSEAAPWSIQVEARVAGSLDEGRLRAAMAQALRTHPMARARKRASSATSRQDSWEIPPTPDLDALRVVDCPDDGSAAAARAELQSLAVPLAESPPLRARLARHPGGDVVMLNVNHAAMDGLGAVRLLQSVARAYSGAPGAAPALDLTTSSAILARAAEADLRTRVHRLLALAEKLADVVVPPARLAPDGASAAAGYGIHHVSLSAPRTRAVLGLDHAGTVNDVLVAALRLAIDAWNQEHGAPSGRIGVLVPASLRPPPWRADVVGNLSLPVRVSTTRRSRRSPKATLDAVTAQTSRKKRSGMGTAALEVLAGSGRLPLWAKQALAKLVALTGDRLVDTSIVSNLGQLGEPPSFGPEVGEATEVWFSPPARMPLGLSVGAVTVAGRLNLAFRYRRRLFDEEAARRFVDHYLSALDTIVQSTGDRGSQVAIPRASLTA